MAYFLKLPFPFKLALNFKFPTKRQSKSFFDMKEFFLQNTPSARALPGAAGQRVTERP